MTWALVFPGQGSQKVGMMSPYGHDDPLIRQTFAEASEVLQQDLWQLAAEGPPEAQALTVNTQPLMLTAGVAVWRLWLARGGPRPTWLAGHSLGEYTALVAAGSLAFADAVALVRLRASAMQSAVAVGDGAMAAVLQLPVEAVLAACREASTVGVVEAVNFNDPSQTVIAGQREAVERAMTLCKDAGAKRVLPLPVSAPFHSSLMRPAAELLKARLRDIAIQPPQIPVIHNVDVAAATTAEAIRTALAAQADHPVRWVETMRFLANHGVVHVVECGPGKVLAGLAKRNDERLTPWAVVDVASLEATIAALAAPGV